MITLNQAQEIVNGTIASEPYSRYGLAPAIRLPLQLPMGWRFPFNSFVSGFRVRHTMVILFVDKQGNVGVEWDDYARQQAEDKAERLEKVLEETRPTLSPLSDALNEVQSKYPEAQIETVEAVLDDTVEGKPEVLLHWRVGTVEGIRRSVLMVSGPPGVLDVVEAKRLYKSFASAEWELDRAKYADDKLAIDLKNLPEGLEYLRGQWTVWSCMARVTEFMQGLGCSEIGPHNVRVEHVASDAETRGAEFEIVNGVPTVSFLRRGGWAEDLSIVLHELGHALWYLLYTRPAKHIDIEKYKAEWSGVQEGFADYLAATLLAKDSEAVEIGSSLDPQEARLYNLPRPIDGQPPGPPSSDDPHEIGRKWANLLWDFRSSPVGQNDADRVILAAHIKPRVGDQAPDEPMACYFQSLKKTAAFMNVRFDGWDDLAQKHGVAH